MRGGFQFLSDKVSLMCIGWLDFGSIVLWRFGNGFVACGLWLAVNGLWLTVCGKSDQSLATCVKLCE